MSDQPDQNQGSDLHIDADWKKRAQAEKEELQQKLEQQEGEGGASGEQIPPADFKTLISTMVSQALLYLGAIPEPSTGQRMVHLDLARHHIDMLGVIEEKTEGNLDDEEKQMLGQSLHELRAHYLNVQQQVATQQAQSGGQADQGGQQSGGGPSIIDPSQQG